MKTEYRNFTDCNGYWVAPKSITPAQLRQIVDYLQAVRARHPAATPEHLGGRIATLLAHYFQATTDENISAMVGADWIDCLGAFPKECLDRAATWWRDNETRKPKPADIRKLAIRFFGETDWERIMRLKELCTLPVKAELDQSNAKGGFVRDTDEQRALVQEMLERAGLIKRVEA